MQTLQGKAALVTGAAGGIGRASAVDGGLSSSHPVVINPERAGR